MAKCIGIDANEANVEVKVGISEYAFQILDQIYKKRENNKIQYDFVIYLKSLPLPHLPKSTSWWKYKIIKPSKLWTQIGLPLHLLLSLEKPDVFLTLTHYAPRFTTIPTIVSVMDLSYIHFPETFKKDDLYQLTNWTKYSVRNARKVITISKSSKDDIIKFYKVADKKVDVVYLGLKNLSMEESTKSLKEFGVEKKFILFVGTLQPRKNIERLIEAYSMLTDKMKEEYQLVIVGKKGWLFEEILEAPKKFNVAGNVIFLDYVSSGELPLFYKNAEVFVLPSLYEGFGLPVLEAMRLGCPVITSNVSSLPEAGGDAALYFDPMSPHEITKAIEKVIGNPMLRADMITKGHAHVKKFTWEKAAEQVISTIEGVVSSE